MSEAVPHPGIHVYAVQSRSMGRMDVVSVLPQEVVFNHGTVMEAVVGRLRKPALEGGQLTPENFDPNPGFADFLHDVIARHAPSEPGLIEAAKRIGHGKVYVTDGRTPTPDGQVPASDIIGAFIVEEGRVVVGSYERNPNHSVLSATGSGFFRLGPALHEQLVTELTARTVDRSKTTEKTLRT